MWLLIGLNFIQLIKALQIIGLKGQNKNTAFSKYILIFSVTSKGDCYMFFLGLKVWTLVDQISPLASGTTQMFVGRSI